MNELTAGFGERLRLIREAAGVSKAALRRATGVPGKCDIARWEAGTVLPGFEALVRLSISLEVSLDELMRGKES